MAKRKDIVEILALLQHMRAGQSNRGIEQELGMDRRTVKKYGSLVGSRRALTLPDVPSTP